MSMLAAEVVGQACVSLGQQWIEMALGHMRTVLGACQDPGFTGIGLDLESAVMGLVPGSMSAILNPWSGGGDQYQAPLK